MTVGPRAAAGALIGLLSAGIALGVGELVAAFTRPVSAPIVAVGNRMVLWTPPPVERWATRTFGTSDKQVLFTGIYLVLAVLAVLIGVLAMHRLVYGLLGVLALGAFGCYAALTAHGARTTDVLPSVLGTLAAMAAMTALVAVAGPARPLSGVPGPRDPGAAFANRRAFLQGSAVTAVIALIAGFGGRASQHARYDVANERAKVVLPRPVNTAPEPAGADLHKGAVPWATPNSNFYRVDTALTLPQVSPGSWSLQIHGMVAHELTLDYDQLLARPMIERWITLCCVSNVVGGNLISNARFLGTRLADLLRQAGLSPDADQLLMRSYDGMTIGAPAAVVMDGRDALIAVGMNGVPLPIAHGFPARIVVPGLYGYVSACKWVVDIEATTFAAASAYWVQDGYAAHPPIELESRIDTPRNGHTVSARQPVAVAGVAWDQHVGVSAVELQVDQGPWLPARLATVPSTDTWRQWVVPWTPPKPGSYTLRVRATDAHGRPQTAARGGPFPAGATGLHTITVRAR